MAAGRISASSATDSLAEGINHPSGLPLLLDGFHCDVDGNLWCGWGMGQAGLDGVHRDSLLMAASTSVYSLYVNTQGAPYF